MNARRRRPLPTMLLLAAAASALAGCGPAPTLANVQETVFTPRCANAACHGGDNPSQGLNLEAGQAYANTVDVDAAAVPGTVRVVPGDPDNSLVYLVTQQAQGAVRKMPVGFDLEPAEVDLLRAWIEDGAPAE